MIEKDLTLGLDLGTSSVKLLLMDAAGKVLAEAREGYPMLGEEQGFFEQDPRDWVAAVSKAAQVIARQLPGFAQRLQAVGLSGQMPTLVLCTSAGELLRNAIVWCDGRAEEEGRQLLALWGKGRYYQKTGIVLDGRYLLPMYRWVVNHEKFNVNSDHLILSAKDYIAFWLTGRAVTDPSTASGYGMYSLETGIFDQELLAEAGARIDVLPEIVSSETVIGGLHPEAARLLGLAPGTAVINGGADSVIAVLGMGVKQAGTVCQMWGSSTAIIAVTEKPVYSREQKYFITPLAPEQTFGVEADLLTTGTASDWLIQLLSDAVFAVTGKRENIPPSRLAAIAEEAPPLSGGLLFYPYFSGGEQGVLWDTELHAIVKGLGLRHRLSHIVRAFFEGMAFEVRRCLEAFAEDGCRLHRMVITGPVMQNSFFMELLADVTGLPVETVAEENGSAYGAAVIAAMGSGLAAPESDLAEEGLAAQRGPTAEGSLDAADCLPGKTAGRRYETDKKRKALYDEAFTDYISNTMCAKFK